MGGLYKTSDGGKNWQGLAADFLHAHRGNKTALITVAPSDSKVIYAYAQLRIADLPSDSALVKKYGNRHLGLIQSQDAGKSWRAIAEPAHRLGAIAIDPENSNTVWAVGPGFYAASTGVVYQKTYYEPGAGSLVMTNDNWKTSSVTYVGCKDAADGKQKQVAYGSIALDPSTPYGKRTLYVCGNMGVMKSTDNGKTWINANNGLDNIDAQMLALHHDKTKKITTLYVTVRGKGGRGGVYKSVDKAASWKNVTADLPVKVNAGCRNIVIDSRNGDTAYVGMSYKNGRDNGLFKTSDGGNSWQRVTHPDGSLKNKDIENCWNQTSKDRVEGLIISQQNPDTLIFADGNCRLFKTTDAGKNWRQTYTTALGENRFQTRGMEDTVTMGILVSPHHEGRVYISEHDFSGLSSFDGGISFYPAALTGVGGRCGWYAFAIDPKEPDMVFGASNTGDSGNFYTSADGGKSWGSGKKPPGSDQIPASLKGERGEKYINRYITSMVVLNDQRKPGRIIISKKTGVYYSDDRGSNWTRAKTGISSDDDFAFHRLYPSKKHPKRVYAIAGLMPNDEYTDYNSLNTSTHKNVTKLQGGLYRSDDEGQSWQHISVNFPEVNASGLAFDTENEDIIYMSAYSWYDNHGSAKSKLRSQGGLYKSNDGGKNWKIITACRKRIYAGLADVALSKKGTLYVAGSELAHSDAVGGVYKSTDDGKSWKDITGKAALNRYTRIVIDPFDQSKIYLGTYGAGSYIRTDQQ